MIKLSLSLLLIGTMSMSYSQYSASEYDISNFSIGIVFTNADYLEEVQSTITPNYAKYLEGIAASWDVNDSKDFDGREAPFKVSFKSDHGYIDVTFDSKGKIDSAKEKFKNVALPKHVMRMIIKKYPNWSTAKNSYSVRYSKGNEITKTLKIQLRKDGVKKNLKIEDSANLL